VQHRLTELTDRTLRVGGWFPGRRIDIAGFEPAWRGYGFPWLPAIATFLDEFSGVEICDLPRHEAFLLNFFDLDDVKSFGAEIKAEYDQLPIELRIPLCPVASVFGSVPIYMSEGNRFYYGAFREGQHGLDFIGDGVDAFLNTFCHTN
jgi:hypothetical protein